MGPVQCLATIWGVTGSSQQAPCEGQIHGARFPHKPEATLEPSARRGGVQGPMRLA